MCSCYMLMPKRVHIGIPNHYEQEYIIVHACGQKNLATLAHSLEKEWSPPTDEGR